MIIDHKTLASDVTDVDRLRDILKRYEGTPTTLALLQLAANVGARSANARRRIELDRFDTHIEQINKTLKQLIATVADLKAELHGQ